VPPTHVLWTRNFSRISASTIERIGAHRSASTFALPIKESNAPGYKSVILLPQDLKSIKSAISAGNRHALAMATELGLNDDKSQNTISLPISEDIIPPKGIVNSLQLEKEVMRMFANAIMFNPDETRGLGERFTSLLRDDSDEEDGYDFDDNTVVRETKEMYTEVDKILEELRTAERRKSEETERVEREGSRMSESVELTANEGESTGPPKKRKRG
jgi:hypothetical protein